MKNLSQKIVRNSFVAGVALVALVAGAGVAYATHSWGGYHWARTSNPFTLKLGDNVGSAWDSILATTSSDWTVSTVLDTTIVAGKTRANCKPTRGRVEVCSNTYGTNNWLGLAQIWIDGNGHITQGAVKVNDTYFKTPTYNTLAWRNLVMCQEVGHTLGLDHQDEIFGNPNLNTCMDYTSDPSSNQHPNAHDYEELGIIYAHADSTTTVGSKTSSKGNGDEVNLDDSHAWGKSLRKDSRGKHSRFERDLGNGEKIVTFVIWAE